MKDISDQSLPKPIQSDSNTLGQTGKNLDSSQPSVKDQSIEEKKLPSTVDTKKNIKLEGRVIEALPNAFFKVLLGDGREVRGFLSGKMQLNRIKILPGDKVTLEMSPYDDTKGRIVYRLK